MTSKTILVIGATGKQGNAVINSLLTQTPTPQILALTRNLSSPSALKLVSNPHIRLVYGDITSLSSASIFHQTGPVDAVFCITVHGKKGFEEAQASNLIDASITHRVSHFVFSSADRGGDFVSDYTPTDIPHIRSKYHIEQTLMEKCANSPMTWTILRPVTFMENLTPNFEGKAFAKMWEQVGSRPIQLVSVHDIGILASLALLSPQQFAGRKIGIAGAAINYEEGKRIFQEVTGKEMPETFCVVGRLVKGVVDPDVGSMFRWFEKEGFKVDVVGARALVPGLRDFGAWLREGSGFVGGQGGGCGGEEGGALMEEGRGEEGSIDSRLWGWR